MTGVAFDLQAYLEEARSPLEEALLRVLSKGLPQIPQGLRGAVEQGVSTGGKRLRPILCMEGWRAAGGAGNLEAMAELAVTLELIHAYSLMHDDLPSMDDAPLRRGLPTPHTLHGVPATTVGAAALMPLAGLVVLDAARRLGLPADTGRELLCTLAQAAGGGGMVGGQALDLMGEGRTLTREELDALHRGKTGALLTASLRMGALAAQAPAHVTQALEAYGRGIGLAFQIADDILDATADAEVLGKEPSDAHRGKSTYVVLLGVQGARQEAEGLVGEAVGALRGAGLHSPPLEALAHYMVDRKN
jgi:geranylgeranyl pyrophosphate synthase